jgi:hypothetical protein
MIGNGSLFYATFLVPLSAALVQPDLVHRPHVDLHRVSGSHATREPVAGLSLPQHDFR